MEQHEREIVKRALSYASTEIRAAQRCVEVLANLFEDMRHELYPHQASRIWHILNQIPHLERMPLYPLEVVAHSDKGFRDDCNARYRWHFMESAMPAYELHHMADDIDALSELLSGQKIEEVALSKGHESYMRYMAPSAEIKFGFTGFKPLTENQRQDTEEAITSPIMPIAEPRKP